MHEGVATKHMHEGVGAKSNILLQNDSNEKVDIFPDISFDICSNLILPNIADWYLKRSFAQILLKPCFQN